MQNFRSLRQPLLEEEKKVSVGERKEKENKRSFIVAIVSACNAKGQCMHFDQTNLVHLS